MKEIRVNGAGCALLDVIYPDADFSSDAFRKLEAKFAGDGGLVQGGLVFESAVHASHGLGGREVAGAICGGATPTENLGGPALVALIHAAQVLADAGIAVSYYGATGDDAPATTLRTALAKTPLDTTHLALMAGETPQTIVLSDPLAHDGQGERAFVNALGVAAEYGSERLPPDFFTGAITLFGGTALVPRIHDDLRSLLTRAKDAGSLTIVATVFDFRSEQERPGRPWILGDGQDTYGKIDLLIADAEEARRLSGQNDLDAAIEQFISWGVAGVMITDGSNDVRYAAHGTVFGEVPARRLPVSAEPARRRAELPPDSHDTTGCGDNFAGGVVANLALQLQKTDADSRPDPQLLDLDAAVIDGIAAGAAAWFYLGGAWIEERPGQKREMTEHQRACYLEQIDHSGETSSR
jgi:sugar/nucleoside kinase (ribokinase family)